MSKTCRNCGTTSAKSYVRGHCRTCDTYERNVGKPRPERLWQRLQNRETSDIGHSPHTPESLASSFSQSRTAASRRDPRRSSRRFDTHYDENGVYNKAVADMAQTTETIQSSERQRSSFVSQGPLSEGALACLNCAITETPHWHYANTEHVRCHACFIWEQKHSSPRPERLWKSSRVGAPPVGPCMIRQDGDHAEEDMGIATSAPANMPRACANLFEHHMPSAQAEADLSAAERTQRDRGEEETNGKIGRLCRLYFQQTNNFRAQLAALNGQNRDLLRRLEPNHDANDEPLPGLQFYLQPLVHEVESLQAEKNSLSDRLEVLQSTQFSQYERWRIAWDDSSEDEFAQAASKSKTSSHVKSLNHGGKRSRKLRRQVQKLKRQAGQLSRQASKDAADAKALRRENQELRSQNLQVDQYTTQQAVILAETEARLLDCQTRISSLEAEMVSLKQQSNRTQAQKEMNDQGTVALPPTPASSDRMPVYDTCENPVKTSLELVKDRLGLLAEQLQHLSSCQVFGTGDAAPNTPIDAFGARK